jgi:L-ascorbate oxidase
MTCVNPCQENYLRITLALAASALGVCMVCQPANAETSPEFKDLPVFASSNHMLDIQITARPKQIQLDEFSPEAWVYEVCFRKDVVHGSCPDDKRTVAEYGGMHLALQQGDHLKIHFINQLPPAPPDCEHLSDAMGEQLAANPTNLHTHGLIVEPRQPSEDNPTYGDYIYLFAYPKGTLPIMTIPGVDSTDNAVDYDIHIPLNHPSGSYFLHPHVHGLTLNQITYGLAGLITVGSVTDYLTIPSTHSTLPAGIAVRNLLLKDMEVLPDGSVLSQADTGYCNPDPFQETQPRNGSCPGIQYADDGGIHDYIGGKWFFTVNGQVFPTIHAAAAGEVWRLSNTSGSRTYQLDLEDDKNSQPIPFQVLAVDGITLDSIGGSSAVSASTGGKIHTVPCPETLSGVPTAICADFLHMMPSSRVEVWVSPAAGRSSATFITHSYLTGPAGDYWPTIRLAHVEFPKNSTIRGEALAVRPATRDLLAPTGLLKSAVNINAGPWLGDIPLNAARTSAAKLPASASGALMAHLNALSKPNDTLSMPCASLAPGHHRRIFFGLPADNPNNFGVGYEEVDEHGNPIPNTFHDIAEFDDSVVNVCLPLAPGNKTATETWELINVSGEDHNFHIHQTKFHVLSTTSDTAPPDALMDNVPVLHGTDPCDGTIATWRMGSCQVKPVLVSIPFAEVGDWVYHCHILEHEDGGMMAHIRVIPAQDDNN